MKPNVVFKSITHPKLTIARDRVELKIPEKMATEFPRIADLANKAIDSVGEVQHTIRGKFHKEADGKYHISLYTGTKTNNAARRLFATFVEE